MAEAPVRFAAIGLDHPHVYAQVGALVNAGAELVAVHATAPGQIEGFGRAFPHAAVVDDERAILEDASIELVTSASIPSERAPLGVRVMQHGKDFLVDKPGATSLDQLETLRRVQRETGRIFSVFFSERLESRATVRAVELVRAGAVGQVAQVVGFGPHRANLPMRPDWFFEPERYGGILCDLASHQVDQFLVFAGAQSAEIVASLVANHAHPEHPGLEDYGEMLLRTSRTSGLLRVDWYTPDGLSTWGDGRLFVLGTEGTLEIRKYCDLGGRAGGDHLLLVDARETRRFDCRYVELPFAAQLLSDVRARTETAMSQAHCFTACELALRAQAVAERRGHLRGAAS
jgi:predicted dehydrogenase